jgi:cyanophycinase-like exopeptidase
MELGNVVFLSSGETSQTGGVIFRKIFASRPRGFRIAVLETPAGFELNSAQVAGRVADAIQLRAGEFAPRIDVIPARRRGTSFGPDSPEILQTLPRSDVIYMGAGSPTYAVRQLRGSLAWQQTLACWQQGAGLVMASAAAVAMGLFALPVYEIFKAGEDPAWKPGLNLFGPLGWKLAVVSHWNNAEGGEELDTSRCFIGRERFEGMRRMLPPDAAVLGLDEHTAVIVDWRSGKGSVEGKGTITLLRGGREKTIPSGGEFALEELGEYRIPAAPFGVEEKVWAEVAARRAQGEPEPAAPPEVAALVQNRGRARKEGNYGEADSIRAEIERLGWTVMDTPQGAVVRPLKKG